LGLRLSCSIVLPRHGPYGFVFARPSPRSEPATSSQFLQLDVGALARPYYTRLFHRNSDPEDCAADASHDPTCGPPVRRRSLRFVYRCSSGFLLCWTIRGFAAVPPQLFEGPPGRGLPPRTSFGVPFSSIRFFRCLTKVRWSLDSLTCRTPCRYGVFSLVCFCFFYPSGYVPESWVVLVGGLFWCWAPLILFFWRTARLGPPMRNLA